MGIVFRQSVKTTIVNFTGAILGLTIFIYSNVLSKTEFGITRNLVNAGAIMQYVVMLGTSALVYVYTQKYAVNDMRRKVLLTLCAVIPMISTLLLTIPYVFFREEIINLYLVRDRSLIREFFLWLPPLVFLWTLMSFLDAYLSSQMKVAFSSFMKEVLLRLCTLGLFILYYPCHLISFYQFVVGTTLIYAIPVLIMFIQSIRTEGFGFSTKWNAFSKSEYKELAHFAWYHLLFGISVFVMGFIDQLMLPTLDKSGVSSLAVYSNAIYIATLIVIPYRAIATSAFPMLNKAYIAGEQDTLTDLFHRSGMNILIVATGMFVLVACNLPNAVAILPKGYEAISTLVLILMLGRVIDMATGLNNELISISKLYKFNFYIALLLLVLVVFFNRLLIPIYGVYGAAWASTLALAIFNIVKMIFLWKKMGLQPFTAKSWRVIVAGAVAGLGGYFLPSFYNAQSMSKPYFLIVCDAAFRSLIIFIIYTLLLLLLKPSSDLNTYLRSVKENKRLF